MAYYSLSPTVPGFISGHRQVHAMPLVFPNDPRVCNFDEQYMLGPSLLVAPVVQPGGMVNLYIPKGKWFGLFDGKCVEGPSFIQIKSPLEYIPVYGLEGHYLPLGPIVQNTSEILEKRPINEVWAFGSPKQDFSLPGLSLDLSGLSFKKNEVTKHQISGTYEE